jgi:hypothetical protein
MNKDIIKCNRCKKTIISEEYSSHLCSPIPNGKIVNVDIDYFIISESQNGETLLVVKDLEGTTYRLTVKEKKEILDDFSYLSPPKYQHPDKTPKDSTEP